MEIAILVYSNIGILQHWDFAILVYCNKGNFAILDLIILNIGLVEWMSAVEIVCIQ